MCSTHNFAPVRVAPLVAGPVHEHGVGHGGRHQPAGRPGQGDDRPGVSQSVASTSGASYNSNGSTIQGLTVNNNSVNVAPNTKVAVKSLGITVAELHVYEESGSSTYAGGVSKSSHSVKMLRLLLVKPFLGFPSGTLVIVAHAQSDAQSPTIGCPGLKSVSGEAFTAYVDGDVAGQNLVEVKVGASSCLRPAAATATAPT